MRTGLSSIFVGPFSAIRRPHVLTFNPLNEVATSVSILPSGVEFYITSALLGAQYEVATSASILPSGVEFYITFALLGAQYEVAIRLGYAFRSAGR